MWPLLRVIMVPAAILAMAICSAGCSKDEEQPTEPGGGGISSAAFPNNTANVVAGGGAVSGTLTGGTPPYSIQTEPDSSVATAELSGTNNTTLTITPVAIGTTSVVIEDSSPGAGDSPTGQTVTITINVTESGSGGFIAGSGTFSVNTSLDSFGAEGAFDTNATSGQGVGALRTSQQGMDVLEVWAYNARSLSDVDLAILIFTETNDTLTPGDYSFGQTSGTRADFGIGFGLDLNTPNPAVSYVAVNGSANLSTLTISIASGTFNGSGINAQNPLETFTFDSGSFWVVGFGTGSTLERKVTAAVHRIIDTARNDGKIP